jgi:hypothetical protein
MYLNYVFGGCNHAKSSHFLILRPKVTSLAILRYVVSVRCNAVVVNSSRNFGMVIIKGTAEEKATEF